MLDVLIPTCKDDVSDVVCEIAKHIPARTNIIISSLDASAAVNRNACLDRSTASVAIMLDDDIRGFYPGWHDDLMAPLLADPLVCMVSARLLTPDGLPGPTCSRCYDLEPEEIRIFPNQECVLPSAAIAFRNIGLRFDERFKGSGWEDNDFCFQYLLENPERRFIQSNRCKLIHANEQKAQSIYWTHNREYFKWKWSRQPCPQQQS